ncbi:MAG: THUMP-like domain-containing protein [Armatimonadota bacterium]
MTEEELEYLLTPQGQEALRFASSFPEDPLSAVEALRKRFGPKYAAAAAEQAYLRRKAKTKFSRADAMYFTREALEQSSAEVVSKHRAKRFSGMSAADLCCGIGGDSIALAEQCGLLVGVDIDPLKVRLTKLNLNAYHLSSNALLYAGKAEDFNAAVDAVFIDPSRRAGDKRIRCLDYTEPPMQAVYALCERFEKVCLKTSPMLDDNQVPLPHELEIVSVAGEVREAVLWFGEFQSCRRRATLLPEGVTITENPDAVVDVKPPGEYLLDPDGAVVRAHLINEAAVQLNAWKLDENIAYLSSDAPVISPLARCYRVLDLFPFNLKRLNRRLNELGAGRIEVKKRGFPVPAEEVLRMLKVSGSKAITVIVARIGGGRTVFLCEPCSSPEEGFSSAQC